MIPLTFTKSKLFSGENFKQQWDALLPADKVLLSMIAEDVTDLHGKMALQRLGVTLGLGDGVTKSTIHNALRRLTHKNIITKLAYAHYQFEDESFKDWVKYKE